MIHADLTLNRKKMERCLFMHLLPTIGIKYILTFQSLFNMLGTSIFSFISPFHLPPSPLCQAVYAVGNFKASEEDAQSFQRLTTAQQKDGLRVLSQRSHDSLYRKTPRVSESREELGAGLGSGARSKVRREKASLASLKRASADVELLATRGPMGKETMVTFSNTLPRVANGNSPISPSDELPTTQRHMTFHVPFDPQRSRQLVSEWKQRSLELRSQSSRDEEDVTDGGDGDEAGEGGDQEMPSSLYPTVQANKVIATPTAPRMVVAPPLVHIPEEASRPPPVSPKSAKTRAKWLSLTEGGVVKEPGKGPIEVSTPRVPNTQPNQPPSQQRVTQVRKTLKANYIIRTTVFYTIFHCVISIGIQPVLRNISEITTTLTAAKHCALPTNDSFSWKK